MHWNIARVLVQCNTNYCVAQMRALHTAGRYRRKIKVIRGLPAEVEAMAWTPGWGGFTKNLVKLRLGRQPPA
jgi:hypothetical protein